MPPPFLPSDTWLHVFGRFLSRHGFGTVVAIYLIWNMVTNQNAKAESIVMEMKDLNAQLLHASQALSLHSDENKAAALESIRIQRAMCVILAQTVQEKRDCVN